MPKSVRFALKNDSRVIEIEAPTIDQYETVASQFTTGNLGEFGRNLIAACITSIDGKPRTLEFDPFREFPYLSQWRQIEKAYARLVDEKGIKAAAQIIHKEHTGGNATVPLPSGSIVVLRPFTLDDEESLLLKHRYTANDWLKAAHDQVIASVVEINGKPVGPLQLLRVELPAAEDWMLLALVHSLLNGQEDVPTFLPDAPA